MSRGRNKKKAEKKNKDDKVEGMQRLPSTVGHGNNVADESSSVGSKWKEEVAKIKFLQLLRELDGVKKQLEERDEAALDGRHHRASSSSSMLNNNRRVRSTSTRQRDSSSRAVAAARGASRRPVPEDDQSALTDLSSEFSTSSRLGKEVRVPIWSSKKKQQRGRGADTTTTTRSIFPAEWSKILSLSSISDPPEFPSDDDDDSDGYSSSSMSYVGRSNRRHYDGGHKQQGTTRNGRGPFSDDNDHSNETPKRRNRRLSKLYEV